MIQNIPTRSNNPGDLRDPSTGQFRVFQSPQEGWSALTSDISNKMQGATSTGLTGQSSLQDFSHVWAPASDNNDPVKYASDLASQLGGSPDDPISKFSPSSIAMAVAKNEGYQGEPIKTFTMEDFGKTIQKKYNQYGSLDPTLVAQKTLAKYPQYRGMVTDYSPTQQTTPLPSDTGTQEPSLGQQLSGRASDISQNISDLAANLQGKGSQGWWSDILQAAGGVAGGLGDVVNAGLELIPGVKSAENWVGGEVSKAADTELGKKVVSQIQSFQQAHPELSKDIGAGFNILTAIPILKGLGVAKEVASSGLSSALEGIAAKGISKEILTTAAKTQAGRDALSSLGGDLKTVVKKGIIDTRAIPDVVDGRYDISEALAKNEAARSQIATKELQPILDKVSKTPAGRMSLSDLRQQAIADAQNKLQDTNAVNRMFDRIEAKYGSNPTLADLNKAKILVSEQVPQRAFDMEGYNANYNVRHTLQKGIERAAILQGLPDVGEINGRMRLLYQADKLLQSLDGKKPVSGLFSRLARKGVSVGAGMLAEKMGGGVVGGLGAGYLTNMADKGILGLGGSLRRGILERTVPGSLKRTASRAATRIPGLFGAAVAQKTTK